MDFKFVKHYSVLIALLALSSVNVTVCAASFAAESKNPRLHWKIGVIPIAISNTLIKQVQGQKSDSEIVETVKRSLESWEKVVDVKFDVSVVDKQSVSPAGKSGDGVNLITVAPTSENILLFSGGFEDISARTQTFYNGKGFITEADIVLNPYQQFSTDGTIGTFDLEATLTHEIGHLLGLEHSFIKGATMFEQQGKNGTYGLASFAPRSLAEDDVVKVRALYRAKKSDADCCGIFTGKILSADGKAAGNLQIWVEENGRVAAGVLTNSDGAFRFDGILPGRYSVYAQGGEKKSSSGQFVGQVEITKGKIVNITKKLTSAAKTFNVSVIGFNGQLSELAIPVNSGRSFLIYVGGENIDAAKISAGFNSANFTIVPDSLTKQDFGAEISVVSFEVRVNAQTLPGEYSFFLRGKNGETAYVVGALTVDDFLNPWNTTIIPTASRNAPN